MAYSVHITGSYACGEPLAQHDGNRAQIGDPSLGTTPVGLRSAVGASHAITIRTRLSGRLSDAWPPAACRPRLFCAAWQRCTCRRYSLCRMRAGPIRAAVHPGGGDEVGEQTAGMASRMSGTRTLARIRRTGPGTTGWRHGQWYSLNSGLGSAQAAAGGWTPRGKGGRRSGLVAGTGPAAGAPCSSSRSQPCLAAGRQGDVGAGGRATGHSRFAGAAEVAVSGGGAHPPELVPALSRAVAGPSRSMPGSECPLEDGCQVAVAQGDGIALHAA